MLPAAPLPPARRTGRTPRTCRTVRLLLAAWTLATSLVVTASGPVVAELFAVAAALRRRLSQLRTARDAGLTTVEVAIITAVLLGLATALVAAITFVVNRNTSKIQ